MPPIRAAVNRLTVLLGRSRESTGRAGHLYVRVQRQGRLEERLNKVLKIVYGLVGIVGGVVAIVLQVL